MNKYNEYSISELLELASKNDPEAMDMLGNNYTNGNNGVPEDKEKALSWYIKAANLGLAEAEYHVGAYLELGWGGLSQNYVKAAEYYTKAADKGNADAQNNLGKIYYQGLIGRSNLNKAVYWIQQAAKQGNKPAIDNLMELYYNGEISKNMVEGFVPDSSGNDFNNTAVVSDNMNSDFKIDNNTLVRYTGRNERVTIPDGIRIIGEASFKDNYDIVEVVFSDKVRDIGDNAFDGCVSLQKVTLNSGLKVIGNNAFSECFSLETVDIPDSVTYIGKCAFRNCNNVTEVTIPNGVNELCECAFAYCDNLKRVRIPDKVVVFRFDNMKHTPFERDDNLTVIVDEGSSAQSFAKKNNIPYKVKKEEEIAEKVKAVSSEQQKQFDEVKNTLNNMKAQAKAYANAPLSATDRQTLDEINDQLNDYDQQMAQAEDTQTKYGDYLKQQEEKERKRKEERERRIAEAEAKGKTNDDEINMLVILTIERELGQVNRKPAEFYDLYHEDLAGLNKKETQEVRKMVLAKIDDEQYRNFCRDAFMKKSVKDRFAVSTRNYFNVADDIRDFLYRADEAVEKTKEWYADSESDEVRKLIQEDLDNINKQIEEQMGQIEPEWKKWSTAKKYLKVFVYDKDNHNAEINKDCRLFQMKQEYSRYGGSEKGELVVEVQICTNGIFQIKATVMDMFPVYWGVTYEDIWKAAMKNEIVDQAETGCASYWANETFDAIKKKYPDLRALKRKQQEAKKTLSSKFVRTIQSLYSNDNSISEERIKSIMKDVFKSPQVFLDCKDYILEYAENEGLTVICDALNNETDAKQLYDDLPILLSENINKVQGQRAREKEIKNLRNTISSDKNAIEKLTEELEDNSKQISVSQAELESKRSILKVKRESYDSVIEDKTKAWRAKRNDLEEEISDTKLYIEKLDEEIQKSTNELNGLTFLQFGRKKELTQIIEGLRREQTNEVNRMNHLRDEMGDLDKKYHADTNGPKNEIDDLVRTITALKEHIAALEKRNEEAKAEMEVKKAEISKLEETLMKY